MSLVKLLILIALGLFVLLILFFPEFRATLKGFVRIFIKDIATTPEGAEALYGEKIEEVQERYNKADDAYKTSAGRLSLAKSKREELLRKKKKIEADCEALVKDGDLEMARLKAEEREEIISEIERCDKMIAAYQDATNAAREAHKMCDEELRSIKRESKEVVENMKTKIQLQEVYDGMDELKKVTTTDKLLGSVRDKNMDLDAIVEGSKVIHEGKTSTKLQRADEKAKKLQSDDYLNALKNKYNK